MVKVPTKVLMIWNIVENVPKKVCDVKATIVFKRGRSTFIKINFQDSKFVLSFFF